MAGNGQRFCLKWNDFRNSVTAVFEDLRQDEELVDITLCCEGKKVKAHRMMLSACSPYFRDLLKENPCQHPVVFLKDTAYNDLQAVIEFVYNGEVNVTQAQLSSFMKTAKMLQVRGLTGLGDDKNSVSAPASPRTQQRTASPAAAPRPFPRPAAPSPVSRPPAAPVRRPMVPAAPSHPPPPPPSPPPPVNCVTAAGRTAAPPAESPPVSPATKRRRLYSEFGSNDGLETSAAAASAASPAATPPSASVGAPPPPPPPLPASMAMPPTDPAGSGFAHSGTVKVEKIDVDIVDNDDEEDLAALEQVVDYEGSYDSNEGNYDSLGGIPVTDASQGEQATPTLQEDDPLREPFTHGEQATPTLQEDDPLREPFTHGEQAAPTLQEDDSLREPFTHGEQATPTLQEDDPLGEPFTHGEKATPTLQEDDPLQESFTHGEQAAPTLKEDDPLGEPSTHGEQATPTLQEDDPLWEPFTHGWRRMLVYRTEGSVKRSKRDCYYFTPTGKRLRSLRDVQTILDETDSRMSMSCFSLQRRLLGVGPPHEIEQQADYNRAVARFTGMKSRSKRARSKRVRAKRLKNRRVANGLTKDER